MVNEYGNNIKVSVVIITYGHEKYIIDCLEGVFMQSCNFDIELIIADDNSPDDTEAIVNNYLLKSIIPKNIEVTYTKHDSNKGPNSNFSWAIKQATGKYIALCEGDDYWIDPLKLQMQFEVLDNNPQLEICSHPSKRRYGDLVKKDNYGYWGELPKIISVQNVIKNYSSTAPLQSIMFRNTNIQELTVILNQLLEGHSTIQIFYSLKGGLYYLPYYMSVYRFASSSSISKTLFKNDKGYLKRQFLIWENLDLLNEYSNYKYKEEFNKTKQANALFVYYNGFLNVFQKIILVKKYKLYQNHITLKNIIYSEIYSILKSVKNKMLNKIDK